MNGKLMRAMAANLWVPAAFLWLCVVIPAAMLAAGPQTGGDSSRASTTSNQPAPSREARSPQTQSQNAANPYKPASTVSAADVKFPFATTADGVVVFSVSLGAEGQVRRIAVLQDVPPFTAAAEQSLRTWKFAPATENGAPENAEMLVAFVFRHSVYIANEPSFNPVLPAKEAADRQGFAPAGILSVAYAAYPASTIAMGAVIVQATVKDDGSAGGVSVLRDLPGDFGKLSVNAAKHWKFQPATRDGQPVPSKVAIAFVFSSRALNPF